MQRYDLGYFNQGDFTLLGDIEKFWSVLERFIYIVPKDIIDSVRSNCVFLMMDTEAIHGGCFIHKKLIKEKSVIAFHDVLYSENEDKQAHKILHEIAHYVLDQSDEGLSDDEYRKQEEGANSLAKKWIDDYNEDQGIG